MTGDSRFNVQVGLCEFKGRNVGNGPPVPAMLEMRLDYFSTGRGREGRRGARPIVVQVVFHVFIVSGLGVDTVGLD